MTTGTRTGAAPRARGARLTGLFAAVVLLLTGCTAQTGTPQEPTDAAAPSEVASQTPSVEPSAGPSLGPVELVELADDAVVGLWWAGCRWSDQGSSTTGWSLNEDLLLTSDPGPDLEPLLTGTQGEQEGELASERLTGSDLALVEPTSSTGGLLTWRESVEGLDGLVAVGWSPQRSAVTATPVTAQDVETGDGQILSFSTAEALEPWLVGAPVLDPGGQVAGIVTQETLLDDSVTTRVMTYAGVEEDFVELIFESAGPSRSPCSLTPTVWTYGDDDDRDDLWDACIDGDVEACDELSAQSEEGSDYHYVGAYCGGLGRPYLSCADETWPEGSDPVFARGQDGDLDALRRGCVRGDLVACDQLTAAATAGSSYARAAGFCGWTTGAWTPGSCSIGDAAPPPGQEPLPDGGLGQDEDTDLLLEMCLESGGVDCDRLWEVAVEETVHHDVALTCGMRSPVASTAERRPCDRGPEEEPSAPSTG